MPARDPSLRLRDIIEAIQAAQSFIGGRPIEHLMQDQMAISAVSHQITIIGEAANHIPPALRDAHPEVPWQTMRGMRNLLIHQYEQADSEIVLDTAIHDLPALIPLLEAMLTELDSRP